MNKIAKFRKEAKLTQSELAIAICWEAEQRSTISNYERGYRAPLPETLRDMIAFLTLKGQLAVLTIYSHPNRTKRRDYIALQINPSYWLPRLPWLRWLSGGYKPPDGFTRPR